MSSKSFSLLWDLDLTDHPKTNDISFESHYVEIFESEKNPDDYPRGALPA